MKRIIRIDASFLSSKLGCETAILYGLLEGYRHVLPNNDMQWGSAFHHFAAEMYRSEGNNGKAFQEACAILKKPCIIKDNKQYLDTVYLGTTCFNWWDWHTAKDQLEVMLLPDGKHAVEQSFEFQVYEDDICIILLCGTIDKIGKIKNGVYCVDDYKTTSVGRERLDYLAQYELSVQLRTYRYAVSHYARVAPDSIYGAIERSGAVGCRITGIFLQGKSKAAEFITSDVFLLTEKDTAEYVRMLFKACLKISTVYKKNKDDVDREGLMSGYCHKKYGVCEFFHVCCQRNPVMKEHMLNTGFVKREYNPLCFNKD